MQESRVKKTLLNARVNLIFYFLTLALSFFSRKIFLDTLGADFVGLTGTLQNLLGFLNLAELGVGSAIGYLLYKPLYDHDQNKINEIISVMGYLYRWIGLIILGAGIILSFFLPLIFPADNTGFPITLIYFAYYSFLGSSLIGYFINYRQNLLGADQRNYVVTAYFQTATIIKTLIQMALAWYTGSYYLWVVIEFTFGVIYSFILNWKINQTYPWLRASISSGRALFRAYPEVMKYTRQIFVHKLTWLVRFQAKNVLIYAFASLRMVAYYNNYMMILDKLSVLSNNFFSGIDASVGNLIAENNINKTLSVYWELFSARFISASIITYCTYILTPNLISLWLGPEFVLFNDIFFLMCMVLFVDQIRTMTEKFLWAMGLFNDVKFAIAEVAIGVILSIVGGYYLGIKGVIGGPLISSLIIVTFWKPIMLFKKGFKMPVWEYYKSFIVYILVFFLSCFLLSFITNFAKPVDYLSWFISGFLVAILYSVILIILTYLFIPNSRPIVGRIKSFIYAKLQIIRH